ncbi:MAG: hypothetical protein IJU10_01015 [Clostridia bacterium]|nr:hypothetical protein [Clostridia bacterium]
MKKSLLILSVLLLVAFCGIALFGCNAAAGEYTFSSATAGAITISADNVQAASLVLNKDKTYSFTFKASVISITESGTYTKDGNTSTTATYESGTLTWKHDSYSLVFKKK